MASDEWNYNKWKALLTAVVLVAGACFIFGINSSGYKNPAWDNFAIYVIPCLLIISFAPLPIQNLIKNIGAKKNDH